MRIVLSTYGSRGDVEPMVALAVGLRTLGVQVRMCAPPDAEFVNLLAGNGVPMVPFAKPWRSWERPTTPPERTRRVAEFIDAQYETVLAAAEGCEFLVATGMSQFVARSVAEKLGIGHQYALFAPNVLTDPDSQNWNSLFGPSINSHRASIDLPPVEDIREFMFTDRPLLATDPVLGPWHPQPNLDVLQTGAWILPDLRPLSPELVAFLEAGTPPVYVGFGSMRGVPDDIAGVAIAAIRGRGHRVLVGSGWAGLVPVDARDDCLVVGEVNHQSLFGQVAAVVHHGGAGTTNTTARAGVPQVVVPQAGGDQPFWGERVAELGIGVAHDGPAPTFDSLSAALTTALTPEVRVRAEAVASTIRRDGAMVAAKHLRDQRRIS